MTTRQQHMTDMIELKYGPDVDDDGVPWCDDECPERDGKRCRILGSRAGEMCLPSIRDLMKLKTHVPPFVIRQAWRKATSEQRRRLRVLADEILKS